MTTTIYSSDAPTLETIEFGAVYRIRAPSTGKPWVLYKTADEETATNSYTLLYRFICPNWKDNEHDQVTALGALQDEQGSDKVRALRPMV